MARKTKLGSAQATSPDGGCSLGRNCVEHFVVALPPRLTSVTVKLRVEKGELPGRPEGEKLVSSESWKGLKLWVLAGAGAARVRGRRGRSREMAGSMLGNWRLIDGEVEKRLKEMLIGLEIALDERSLKKVRMNSCCSGSRGSTATDGLYISSVETMKTLTPSMVPLQLRCSQDVECTVLIRGYFSWNV